MRAPVDILLRLFVAGIVSEFDLWSHHAMPLFSRSSSLTGDVEQDRIGGGGGKPDREAGVRWSQAPIGGSAKAFNALAKVSCESLGLETGLYSRGSCREFVRQCMTRTAYTVSSRRVPVGNTMAAGAQRTGRRARSPCGATEEDNMKAFGWSVTGCLTYALCGALLSAVTTMAYMQNAYALMFMIALSPPVGLGCGAVGIAAGYLYYRRHVQAAAVFSVFCGVASVAVTLEWLRRMF